MEAQNQGSLQLRQETVFQSLLQYFFHTLTTMTNKLQQNAARQFAEEWKNRGYEKGESQTFWYQLLHDVFGIDTPADFILFERPVHLKNIKFIDAYIPSTKVLIEQKSSSEELHKSKKQSDKEELTPYQQALRYSLGLKYSERPRWIIISNFNAVKE